MKAFFGKNDDSVLEGDHFDDLAVALRLADSRGIHSAVALASGLQLIDHDPATTSRDVAIHLTTSILRMVKEKHDNELIECEIREYMSKFGMYLGALPQAVQNEMRRELSVKFHELLTK